VTDIAKAAIGRYLDLVAPTSSNQDGRRPGRAERPLMSPKTYRAVVKPYHKELCDFIHARTTARVFLHTVAASIVCCRIYRRRAGCAEPGAVSAADMETRRLKAEFG